MSASKISIDDQIAAVSSSATIAHAAAEYQGGNREITARARGLDAARRTLEAVRDNADAFRRVLREAAEAREQGPAAPEERRRWTDLPLATQAAMRCNDVRFQRFLDVADADAAAVAVRRACGVESRTELDAVPEAGRAWRKLDAEFEAWLLVEGAE